MNGDGRLGDGTHRVNLSGGTLNYNGSVEATPPDLIRSLTVPNPIRLTADSILSYSSTTANLAPAGTPLTDPHNIYFVFSNDDISGTAGTLTLMNDGVCTSNGNSCAFRPTFSGSGFDFNRPVVISNQINDAVTGRLSSRSTVLQSTNTSGTQTWSGDISGTGSYLRNGAGGTSILSGNNSYLGNTTVQAGTLSITHPYLADAADVLLSTGGFLNLSFSGTDTINRLFIDGVSQATGTWGALLSGATHETALITGSGFLQVLVPGSGSGQVPEPGTFALVIIALGAGLFSSRGGARRRES